MIIEQIPSEKMDSNSYIVEEDGHVIIVDGSSYEGVVDAIEAGGWSVDQLLLTHEHFDHIWFLEALREKYHMPVVACQLTSDRIQDAKTNLSNIQDILYYYKTGIVREGRSPMFTCQAADVTFEDAFTLDWQGHTFEFQRLPGHSPGSCIITLDGEHVFSGDYLIEGEGEITRLKGGSDEDYEAFAEPVLSKIPAGTMIYPGHGKVYRLGDPGKAEE